MYKDFGFVYSNKHKPKSQSRKEEFKSLNQKKGGNLKNNIRKETEKSKKIEGRNSRFVQKYYPPVKHIRANLYSTSPAIPLSNTPKISNKDISHNLQINNQLYPYPPAQDHCKFKSIY